MNVQKVLKEFLIENLDFTKPILLALSGGPDSMALFHLLIRLKDELGFHFAVAHVNHNWREESKEEANLLEQMAVKWALPFHLSTLDPTKLKGNLELACRLERLKFFKELCQSDSYQAVILGHHLDDQAETLLKRLFEGASLQRLGGLKKIRTIDGLKIFRPLLDIRKKEIEAYLEHNKVDAFKDNSNSDPKYMRARFRTKLIPYLTKEFGKDIAVPLYRLGLDALELNDYLHETFKVHKEKIVKDRSGSCFDFSGMQSSFEIKYFIRMFVELEGFYLSHALIKTACTLILDNASNKSLFIANKQLFFHRKKMFIRTLETAS